MTRRHLRRTVKILALLAVVALAGLVGVSPAQARATSYVSLLGDGSSWAQPAIDQWSRDVSGQGITINFSGDGSAAGRQHYIQDQADFAASDIAFLTTQDPFGGGIEQSAYAYSYVPIVAGGTSFLYNLVVAGQRVTNLRLSGETLAKIFTGKITNWDDPAITHDYGAALPSQPITVVTRSDGSGASYMLTQWMAKQYPSLWGPFCQSQGGTGCGPTEFYPPFSGSVQRNGSDQVAGYISNSSYGPGSIGYDEYSYALNLGIPVVSLLNQAGYYQQPTPSNVAIALQAAVIDENPSSPTFLMQKLDGVYVNKDPRSYPLSSYSYLIVPRTSRIINGSKAGPPPRFTTDKGKTLSTWMNYVLCGAQQSAGQLGYSPLPKNLVVGGFKQMDQVPGHVPTPDLKQLNGCDNPTYSNGVNHLIKDAPYPTKCQKVGSPLLNCDPNSGSGPTTSSSGNGPGKGPGKSHNSGGPQQPTGGQSTTPGVANPTERSYAPVGPASGGASTSAYVDPITGQTSSPGTTNTGTTPLAAVPVSLGSQSHGQSWLMATLIAIDIVAAIALPGILVAWLRRRRASQS